jgi:hypothetical protein
MREKALILLQDSWISGRFFPKGSKITEALADSLRIIVSAPGVREDNIVRKYIMAEEVK